MFYKVCNPFCCFATTPQFITVFYKWFVFRVLTVFNTDQISNLTGVFLYFAQKLLDCAFFTLMM